ncbi:unnamed protein product [Ambrosiozyma monospora]|uniref:Unnamed protein product n=1 Tax=Ambrosiozyma monospora TaxID=43982 RepID=A0ACB5TY85_AMBMO|nr:unnamed protein product [Ambrosiozyma monospora]
MIVGMFSIISAGPLWTIALVIILQILVFKECISITSKGAQNEDLQHSSYLNWYFLATTLFYLEGRSFIKYTFSFLLGSSYTPSLALKLLIHHKFICYCMYVLGFVGFVALLRTNSLKAQFSQLCITHMLLIFVISQGYCIVNNIMHGMFWFLFPVGLVITNDIFAYLCGITFGKTQLISISPKKTVEGFVGAWICTTIMSILLTYIISNSYYFICPVNGTLSVNCLSGITCDPNPVFIEQIFTLPVDLAKLLGREYIYLKPIYLHSMVLATFASLFAPFGGFFASGLKRAVKVKDFGDTIPGHGGVTDRMDCQFLMGSFSYLYYEAFISTHQFNVGNLLQTIVINLSVEEILVLVTSLLNYLYKMGAIDEDVHNKIIELLI